jgi:hypothetical protein
MAGGKFGEGMIANIKEDMKKGANSPGRVVELKKSCALLKTYFIFWKLTRCRDVQDPFMFKSFGWCTWHNTNGTLIWVCVYCHHFVCCDT